MKGKWERGEKRAGHMTQRSGQQTQVFPVILNKAELNRDLINFTVFTFNCTSA